MGKKSLYFVRDFKDIMSTVKMSKERNLEKCNNF